MFGMAGFELFVCAISILRNDGIEFEGGGDRNYV